MERTSQAAALAGLVPKLLSKSERQEQTKARQKEKAQRKKRGSLQVRFKPSAKSKPSLTEKPSASSKPSLTKKPTLTSKASAVVKCQTKDQQKNILRDAKRAVRRLSKHVDGELQKADGRGRWQRQKQSELGKTGEAAELQKEELSAQRARREQRHRGITVRRIRPVRFRRPR